MVDLSLTEGIQISALDGAAIGAQATQREEARRIAVRHDCAGQQ